MNFSLAQLASDLTGLSPEEHGFSHLDLHSRPEGKGRLSGWVLSAKDLVDVAGMPTTFGAKARTRMATTTDPFVAGLQKQGAHIVGKSATSELGLRVDTEPAGLPHPVNPLFPGATPGGSSGGAAVQVARGLLRAAHASDGGGSIRVPAAACGVVGFKPTGTGEPGRDLAVPGFITRTVADAAFLHDITPCRPQARIGVLTDPLFAHTRVSPVMEHAVHEAAAKLRSAGFTLVPIKPYPHASDTFTAFTHIFSSQLATLPATEGYTEWIRQMGLRVSQTQRRRARTHALGLPSLLAQWWGVDAILSPVTSDDPPPVGHFRSLSPATNFHAQTRWTPWGSLFNVAHLPAISVPWNVPGRTPVGVHLGGITLNDAELLGLGQELHP